MGRERRPVQDVAERRRGESCCGTTAVDAPSLSPGGGARPHPDELEGGCARVLPSVQCPTLVLHRTRRSRLATRRGRALHRGADSRRSLHRARAATITCPMTIRIKSSTRVEEFLTGARPAPHSDRVLATILFTDLVGSTGRAQDLGDAALGGSPGPARRGCSPSSSAVSPEKRSTLPATGSSPSSTARRGRFGAHSRSARSGGARARCERRRVHTGEVERPAGEKPRRLAIHVGARIISLARNGRGARQLDDPRPRRRLRTRVRGPRRARAEGGRGPAQAIRRRAERYATS